jgi:hypothetical protein
MRWGRLLVALFSVVAVAGSATACSGNVGASGSGGGGGEVAAEWSCSRDELRFAVGSYVNALTARDPALVPFSADAKATENAELTEPGQGLWQTAGAARFYRSGLDTETCGTHTQAVFDEDGTDIIVGIRLRLSPDAPEITEAETYVTRDGDYFVYNPAGLLASDSERPDPAWEGLVPEDQRSTREELYGIADAYFEMFGSSGVEAPFSDNCDRWENGNRMTEGDCNSGIIPGLDDLITNRRYVMADVEAGIVVGYAIFGGALDFHMFKVVGGQVHLIQAVITDSGHDSSGWEEQEQPPPV